jgi:dTDP-4-dehydrorhamnose 3,5-epimerase
MTDIFPVLSQYSQKNEDARGSLEILYETNNLVLKRSFSRKGVFRGMHLQLPPHTQTKLIRVISGRIIDFVVEPNNISSKIHWQEIDSTSDWIKIDSKFAHGFYALEDTTFEYICDGAYNERTEQSYSITDFLEKIMGIKECVLSEKDANAQQLSVSLESIAS